MGEVPNEQVPNEQGNMLMGASVAIGAREIDSQGASLRECSTTPAPAVDKGAITDLTHNVDDIMESQDEVRQEQSDMEQQAGPQHGLDMIKIGVSQLSSGICDSSEDQAVFKGVGEGKTPLWIKWRGKWQAGIQCSLKDCPAQTAKAMPTYGRKSYIVVFFPSNKAFTWIDWQLTCSISESPEPLSFGSHESGRNSVLDLNAAKVYMLHRLVALMLDISDRLPITAVEDCARDVNFWKDFASEAKNATTYQELGTMLVKLKNMILPSLINETWISTRVLNWEHQCRKADAAGSLEMLVKELKDSVSWDEVERFWDALEQGNLGPEWKSWKHHGNSIHGKAWYSSFSVTGHRRIVDACNSPDGSDKQGRSGGAGNDDSEQYNKRLKLEQESVSKLHQGDGCTIMQLETGKNIDISSTSDFVSKVSSLYLNPNNGVGDAETKTQSRSSRCLAFSDRRGRQCNKYAKEGSAYCCKHIPSTCNNGVSMSPTENQKKAKPPVSNTFEQDSHALICSGMTKYGRRCTHRARDGSVFCLKHMLHEVQDSGKSVLSESSVTPLTESGVTEFNLGTPNGHDVSNRKRKIEQSDIGQSSLVEQETSTCLLKSATKNSNLTRCTGWCGSGAQCSHRAKPGFSYCEKHIPGASPYAKRGQEKVHTKESSGKTLNCKVNIAQLKDVVHEYLKARLSNEEAQSSQQSRSNQQIFDLVLKEASGSLKALELLYGLVTDEMEELKKLIEERDVPQVQDSLVPLLTGCLDHNALGGEKPIEHLSNVELLKQVSSLNTQHFPRYRCKLCAHEFVDLIVLGEHWRDRHKKEAQQYFRGYTCQHCNLPFTNKKGLYRHKNAHHSDVLPASKSSLSAPCIICNSQYVNFEELWQHVISTHPDQLCAFWPPTDSFTNDTLGLEIDAGKSFHFDENAIPTRPEFQQGTDGVHKEQMQSPQETAKRISDAANEFKFKCKICGLRFRLLPDLGRHHQAQHKPAQISRLKNAKEMSSSTDESKSIIGLEKEKKKPQKLDIRRAPSGKMNSEVKAGTQIDGNWSMATIESYSGTKFQCYPNNQDILTVARFSCCTNRLYSILEKKYTSLPDSLASVASKLCNEANLKLHLFQDGYVCPNRCQYSPLPTVVKTDAESLSIGISSSQIIQMSTGCATTQIEHIALDENLVAFPASSSAGDNSYNKIILCEDLSFGKEQVPIPCVLDRDAMEACNCATCMDNPSGHLETLTPWLHFSYVTKRTLDPSLGLDTESSRVGCSCQEHQCSSANCEHVYLFDNDNIDAEDIYGKPMSGRFPYDDRGCIILEEGYLVYECNSLCNCSNDCHNRVLQKGVRVKLEVYKTRHKGWAVRAAQHIPRGTFVCEYIGEVLDDCEANRRGERYDKEGCSYLYDIDAHIDISRRGRPKPFVIDATKFGNVARFINHSCSPNLVNYQVLVESMDCQLAHIGLYATRDINIGEELAYDYRYKLLPGKGCPCHCGAKDCRGRLY